MLLHMFVWQIESDNRNGRLVIKYNEASMISSSAADGCEGDADLADGQGEQAALKLKRQALERNLFPVVRKAVGDWAIRMRCGYLVGMGASHEEEGEREALYRDIFPLDLTGCGTVQEVKSTLEEELSAICTRLEKTRWPAARLLTLPPETLLHMLFYVAQPKEFRVSRQCSALVTGHARHLCVRSPEDGTSGVGISIMARHPKVEVLRLRNFETLCNFGFLCCGGWGAYNIKALRIDSIRVGGNAEGTLRRRSEMLRSLLSDLYSLDPERLVELSAAVADKERTEAHATSAGLIEFIQRFPNLTSLELRAAAADGFIGLSNADVSELAKALHKGVLRNLALELDNRGATGMRLDALLEQVPRLTSLNLSWMVRHKALRYGEAQPVAAAALLEEGVGMVAAALPTLPRLKHLKLVGETFYRLAPMPVFKALTAAPATRLETLSLRLAAWEQASFIQLLRSGKLSELEHLSLDGVGLHWRNVFTVFREAVLPDNGSRLPMLRSLDVRYNPLLLAEEVANDGISVFPSDQLVVPPRLISINVTTRTPSSAAILNEIKRVFHPAAIVG